MFQTGYCQAAGTGKSHNHDALFNGAEIKQAKTLTTKIFSPLPDSDGLIRAAVADGEFNSPNPRLASHFWMQAFAERGRADAAFLRREFPRFCQTMLPQNHGSSTTFAAAEISADGQARICNVGDSRIYHIEADGGWTQISHDHTVLAEMLEKGEARADTEYAGFYTMLAECLIADTEEGGFKVHTAQCRLNKGDSLLLCSDGLTDSLDLPAIAKLWQSHHALADKLEALRKAVKRMPLHDDLSIVCVQKL